MEDSSSLTSHNNGGGQMGPSPTSGPASVSNKHNEDENKLKYYSIPGILHFIQNEWTRFEMERSQWEVERAELQARIAFLQGERKGQENLKNDLIRRIKMLEYALKQERLKLHKLKYGTDLNVADLKPQVDDINKDENLDGETFLMTNSNVSWKQGRQLLRQYLQEIGYSDTIVDVRSAQVRTILGITPNDTENEENQNMNPVVNGEQTNKRISDSQGRRIPSKKIPTSVSESTLMDSEDSVLATFDFLASENVDMDEDEDESGSSDDDEERIENKRIKQKPNKETISGLNDSETEEVLAEFDFLGSDSSDGPGDNRNAAMQGGGGGAGGTGGLPFPAGSRRPLLGANVGDEDAMEEALGLGELAGLTVNNEADVSYDISANEDTFRRTWNAKYTLRSHFDGIRALAFHPVEPVLITASEDQSLKLWNLQKTVPAKKTASLDVEPVYTFRAHKGPVLCIAINHTGEQCYTGGADSTIRCWNVPNSNIDPYDSYDPGVMTSTLTAHTDAVWGVSIHSSKPQLLSCSSDGTVKLWAPQTKVPLLNTYTAEAIDGLPTSVDYVRCDPAHMVVGYTSSNSIIYDLETRKPVIKLEIDNKPDGNSPGTQIYKIVSHPTYPLTITAHEDKNIRFFDNNTGKMVHSMVAHLDAVTSLAIDPNGLYLLSGSHDCSIRLWNLENKTCVQEITAHRKKFDESIFDVAFHPSRPYIASAGSDALAKVFV